MSLGRRVVAARVEDGLHLRVVGVLFGYEGNARILAPVLFSFPTLIPPKHKAYPAVEEAIWQGIREALLGHKSVEEALRETEAEASQAAEDAR